MHIRAALGRMFIVELNSLELNIVGLNQEHSWPTSILLDF